MELNPDSPQRLIKVRTTDGHNVKLVPTPGVTRYAVWCGPNPPVIAVLKATPGCHFDQASKRWYFEKPNDPAIEQRIFHKLTTLARVDWENLDD